jgi:hypothetical protein
LTRDKGGFEAAHTSLSKVSRKERESPILPESVELLDLLPNTEDAIAGLFFLCWCIEAVEDNEKEGGSGRGRGSGGWCLKCKSRPDKKRVRAFVAKV